MTGIFDSGLGGLNALSELRKVLPSTDICFFADRHNAPYGTKSERELISLVKRDIALLRSKGADRILMACCTASTVYEKLPKEFKRAAVPIILPTAREAARVTKNGRIGVIGTERTVASHTFKKELLKEASVSYVSEIPTQKLVSLTENGCCDGNLKDSERTLLLRLLKPFKDDNIDTLILGCTHFQKLEREILGIMPGVRTVSSAREGAKEIAKYTEKHGKGRTVYLP